MNGRAFLQMMKEDLETSPEREKLMSVYAVMEHVISRRPDCEIDPSKNAEDCFQAIFEAAKKNESQDRKGSRYCFFGNDEAIAVVEKYLGLAAAGGGERTAPAPVNLEDFF